MKRHFAAGAEVRVYFHRRRKLWSVQDRATRRVVLHTDRVRLGESRFVVSEAGRLRTLRTGRRNVHAFAQGRLEAFGRKVRVPAGFDRRVVYSPFKGPSFVDLDDGSPVRGSTTAVLVGNTVYIPRAG